MASLATWSFGVCSWLLVLWTYFVEPSVFCAFWHPGLESLLSSEFESSNSWRTGILLSISETV